MTKAWVAWTEDDDALLRQLAQDGKTPQQISSVMGRGYWAIIGHARRIGVDIKSEHPKNRWTSEELESLRKYVTDSGRSYGSVAYGLSLLSEDQVA